MRCGHKVPRHLSAPGFVSFLLQRCHLQTFGAVDRILNILDGYLRAFPLAARGLHQLRNHAFSGLYMVGHLFSLRRQSVKKPSATAKR